MIPNRMLRRAEVETLTGLSRSSIYELMREGEFPLPLQVGKRAVRWPESEIAAWLAERPRATGWLAEGPRQRESVPLPSNTQVPDTNFNVCQAAVGENGSSL